eukprot:snap_masked-scaffold_1-processed-gene-23.52-mRNA-1 protein AED:1.00 eAED:1.00 QI:0/0/0/0/1/1/2/0/61
MVSLDDIHLKVPNHHNVFRTSRENATKSLKTGYKNKYEGIIQLALYTVLSLRLIFFLFLMR